MRRTGVSDLTIAIPRAPTAHKGRRKIVAVATLGLASLLLGSLRYCWLSTGTLSNRPIDAERTLLISADEDDRKAAIVLLTNEVMKHVDQLSRAASGESGSAESARRAIHRLSDHLSEVSRTATGPSKPR